MNSPLIFTEQRLFPRAIDFLMTLCGWGGFIWLLEKGLLAAIRQSPWQGFHARLSELNTFSLYLAIGIFNALVLIGWAKYNQYRFATERRQRVEDLSSEEVARSFSIHTDQIAMLNQNRVQHVWHSEDGNVVRIEEIGVNRGQ
ncbi:poly-beta-1,6-N-acetyl-D-glucosamine biosynthesis protein PgaD [Brenneria corticis]|uniref:Poly-beta-1,6-N-acetyl-D-glucosamine biosynthesis protein PgaD n=1 Tax=Brenneria corticis TaxID=2173106 RepID=A0A2U1U338_9GAMM|nr:poly-beta-1,6-N-acetyl-D-glucosamine biosynthesis protein PgaD [Brenneria sp. CFCC 11842]PWC16060.1 poly-beta-1,6-N-acetyl-D-glucosamine biosynthesis protein PgaD [Brenneria sp. CFCC 11842]